MAPESRKSIWKAQGNDEQLDLECLCLPWGNFKQKVQKEVESFLKVGFMSFFITLVYLTQANKPT